MISFKLSKTDPVYVMIDGNTEFVASPIELTEEFIPIKEYRFAIPAELLQDAKALGKTEDVKSSLRRDFETFLFTFNE